jgi:hypothetical protein
MLGTIIWLFIPASVHLYMDKLAGDLLLTNLRGSESTLSLTNESPSKITILIRVNQSQCKKMGDTRHKPDITITRSEYRVRPGLKIYCFIVVNSIHIYFLA